MTRCAAVDCKNIGIHLFPKEAKRRKLWEKALRRNNWKASTTARLCPAHFQPEDYYGRNSYTDRKMKVLSEDRTRKLFEKLTKYIGVNVKLLIDRPDGTYCFREKKDRVYYISERLLQLAQTVKPDHLISAGTCFGKFTKTNKFRLHITALTYIAPYAPYKIWLKPSAEQQFLYGHHVIKSGLGRITENTPKNQGVVIHTMSDIPIGFGVVARSTAECRHADPLATIAFHQADIGEYIRSEDTLV